MTRLCLLILLLCSVGAESLAFGEQPLLVDPAPLPFIYFEAGHPRGANDLSADTIEGLEFVAKILSGGERRVWIAGYADKAEGTDGECQVISERRALIVSDWLLDHGVNAVQIAGHRGFGASQSASFSGTERERSLNRRVEFRHSLPTVP